MAKILVADDDPDLLLLIELVLTAAGHHVVPVPDGEEALAQARRGGWDAVVLDVQMPGRTGLDVLRLVREDAELGCVPVVLLTGNSSDQAVASGHGAGADDYVVKPFALADLRTRVESLVVALPARPEVERAAS